MKSKDFSASVEMTINKKNGLWSLSIFMEIYGNESEDLEFVIGCPLDFATKNK
ncbi:hypothetical protein ACFOG5_10805 [Pedobacter fastidiosus]|uniref:hypothetical protein n=1 Tax=Pedobacter fastidiosus TaxID=2765361 RepID=UPI00164D8939|nr:hypothetical protein [Pedobacter fastidiosus]